MTQQLQITGNDAGQRLDKFLRKHFPQLPLSKIYQFLRQKKVRVLRETEKFHGKKADLLQKGDTLKLYFDVEKFGEAPVKKPVDFDFILQSKFYQEHFQVHYEDEFLFVAEKKAGIAVHPGTKTPWGKSLIDLFVAMVRAKNPDAPEPKLAHRLDKETSGLLLISKNDATLRKLTALLREGSVEKKYLALIKGKMPKEKGKIEMDLVRTEGSKYTKIQVARHKTPEARTSRTFYEVREYFPELDATLVEVILDTGRMHQIRVHFATLGHPLAGDDAYGNFDWNKELKAKFKLKRQFLHAHSLAFRHPETGKFLTFSCELPADLKKILPPR